MPTLAAGRFVSILWPTDGQITITPGNAGRVSLNARGRDGSQSIAPREIYNAETINVSAGDTVILEAINTDATYTSPVSGDGVAIRKQSIATRAVLPRMASTANSSADRTTNIQAVLAAPFAAVRIGIPNAATADVAGVKVAVAPTANIGAGLTTAVYTPSGGTSAFVTATFGGAATGTLPAAAAFSSPAQTSLQNNYSVTWTDWIDVQSVPRADGGPGVGIIVRVVIPGTGTQAGNTQRSEVTTTNYGAWINESVVGTDFVWRALRRDDDSIANLGTIFTLAWVDSHQPVVIQYATPSGVYTIGSVGDSLSEGTLSETLPAGYSAPAAAVKALRAAGYPVEYCNFGCGSANSHNFIVIAEKWAPLLGAGAAMVWPTFTPNLTPTAANVAAELGKSGRFLSAARAASVVPVLWTGMPSTPIGTEGSTQGRTWDVADDARRIAANASWTGAVAGAYVLADVGAAADGGAMPSGQRKLRADWSLDGLHLNDAGKAGAGAVLAASIARRLA